MAAHRSQHGVTLPNVFPAPILGVLPAPGAPQPTVLVLKRKLLFRQLRELQSYE